MTVHDRVREDIKGMTMFMPGEVGQAACVICGDERFLRYGCCLPCAKATDADDPRTKDQPRFGRAP